MVREIDAAWAAGFFDGEGCVMVCRSRSPNAARGVNLSLVVSVSQLDRRPLDRLAALYGGRVYTQKKAAPTQSGRVNLPYRWGIQGEAAIKFLESIFAYCSVKKEQIDIALEWPEKAGRSTRLTDRDYEVRSFIWDRLKELKIRGNAGASV